MSVLTENDMKTVYGFEVEKSMKLTKKTKEVIKSLRTNGSVIFERDDGLEGYRTMEQLIRIGGAIGLHIYPRHLECLGEEDLREFNGFPYDMVVIDTCGHVNG